MDIVSLEGFFYWLAVGGGGVALFVLVAEDWKWFQGFSSSDKKLLSNFISAGIALLASLVLSAIPAEYMQQVDSVVKIIFVILTSIYGKEFLHKIANK